MLGADGDGRCAGGGPGVPREARAGLDGQVTAVAEPVAVASVHTIVALGSVCTRPAARWLRIMYMMDSKHDWLAGLVFHTVALGSATLYANQATVCT